MVDKNYAVKYGEIISKCWKDEAYKKRFIQDPESVLEEAGIPLEEGIEYKVIEAPKMVQYIVLPREEVRAAVQVLAKRFLNKADETDKIVPPGVEVRIVQNTEDTDYLILPASPKTLTAAELSGITGGGSAVHAAAVAVQVVEAEEVVTTTTTIAEVELVTGTAVAVVVGVAIVLI